MVMKQFCTSILLAVVAMTTVFPGVSFAQEPLQEGNPEVSGIEDSGCTNVTRANPSRTLVMTKEGDIVTCEIRGIEANCGVGYFDINMDYKEGKDAQDSLFLDVSPVILSEKDCTCPYNVSFTIRNVKSDSFFLYCWVYTGVVSFKESNQVAIEFTSERVTIDGSQYNLYKPGNQAMLYKMAKAEGEVRIPSTVNYEGQEYMVMSFDSYSFAQHKEMTKLSFPNTIRKMGESNTEMSNYFNALCPLLEAFEVEPGCPLFSSIDGMLYSGDAKNLYCLPAGRKLTEYAVPDGVERIGKCAFVYCTDLKTLRLPESVTIIRPWAFIGCSNLNAIYIPGKLNQEIDELYEAFEGLNSTATLYVPDSDVENYKKIYQGTVLPISSSEEALGISDVTPSSTMSADSYDLQGRPVKSTSKHGIYVKDGRKVVR